MKRVLVLGASGMLGHKAYQVLSQSFEVHATLNRFDTALKNTLLFDKNNLIIGVNAFDFQSIKNAIDQVKPDFIVNCIGIIKQVKNSTNSKVSIYINSLFPHLVEEVCKEKNCKLIHISTDCVFSGSRGNYTEEDQSDAQDLYGKTKYLGETQSKNALTLRTSIIGRELFSQNGLVEWFLSQNHRTVHGYIHAIYTGLSTIALVREIVRVINEYPELTGLFHISSEKISKYNLLKLIKKIYNLDIHIIPDENFFCDRSLDSSHYRKETHFSPLTWEEMIQEMFQDPTHYYSWRGK
jgi:dTDP-4-dehydrorhamnose reductase